MKKKCDCAIYELQAVKAIIKGASADHSVGMVTYCGTKMIRTCSLTIWQICYSMIVASTDSEVLECDRNCFEPP